MITHPKSAGAQKEAEALHFLGAWLPLRRYFMALPVSVAFVGVLKFCH